MPPFEVTDYTAKVIQVLKATEMAFEMRLDGETSSSADDPYIVCHSCVTVVTDGMLTEDDAPYELFKVDQIKRWPPSHVVMLSSVKNQVGEQNYWKT